MESSGESHPDSFARLINSIFIFSAVLQVLFIHFLLNVAVFIGNFLPILLMGIGLYFLAYMFIIRKLTNDTKRPEIAAAVLIIFSLLTLSYAVLGISILVILMINGHRKKKLYKESHPRPPNYVEYSQSQLGNLTRPFEIYRLRKRISLAVAMIMLLLYGIAVILILGFYTPTIEHFFPFLAPLVKGQNPSLFLLVLSIIGFPLSFTSTFNPVSKVYKFLPGKTGTIIKQKRKNKTCKVKVEGLTFLALNPMELDVGSEISVTKVVVSRSTKIPILQIRPRFM